MAKFDTLIADVRKQFERGNIKQGITVLKKGLSDYKGTDVYTQVETLEAQFKVAERAFNMGGMKQEDMSFTSNRVTGAILRIVAELPENEELNEEPILPLPPPPITKHITFEGNSDDNKVDLHQTIDNNGVQNLHISVQQKKKILFLASNPSDTAKLKLSEEFQIVSRELQNCQDKFSLRQVFELTADKLHEAMLSEHPDILHFSGHGLKSKIEQEDMGGSLSSEIEKSGGLVLQSKQGNRHIVETQAIANLFKLTMKSGSKIEVVLFNACYSEEQANAINQYVPYVIGMNNAVDDGAAIEFTTGFYRAISEGQSVELAFEWGVTKVELEGYTGANIPVLHKKSNP